MIRFKWKDIFTSKKAKYLSLGCIVILLMVNIEVLIAYGSEHKQNGTVVTICFATQDLTSAWMGVYLIVRFSFEVQLENSKTTSFA